ncbi:MAG: hypothetical protein JWO08_943 [Verrucomicrobiaceae bacterium]|nr:hypothetical protein [Verrucomicrobiaceae bacterium]
MEGMETETPIQYQPFAAVPELETVREKLLMNVPEHERAISVFTGIAAILIGLAKDPSEELFLPSLAVRPSTGERVDTALSTAL